ncbi:hypothetical protein AJ85_06450 [Alkalihalobacillus alcalophilus ATCC 27647 = CGMCC 1.3604]|uniref:Allose kinase n=1 Tax=Alkalihalobacillus alcalophilus ATCC 27647 = CGMCC 1.3604 TaxID=1218173 RepID=A0A4S4K2M3_ALKAL|nr:allose kinase [Alkalihalobacillus alcalophilus]MED1562431.1 allose kinase [Alkalihalobacillus alcalophilus]THG91167.1 hypothetical protein AJ85_06450 [Alkalihalobacillus alcalophilus ATCC 27647 = CGMCC 1.3604]
MEIKKQKYVIGVDIGGTHIRIGAVTHENNLFYYFKKKVVDVINVHEPIESLIRFLEEYIQEHMGIKQVMAIGMGFPSVISKDKKSIHSTPNLECLSNTNIVDDLQHYFKIPIFIEKDVNYLLQYELSKRTISEEDIVLGFYIGTGFGNSIYLNQNFLRGKNGAAGELGHIPVMGDESSCQCGNSGCIEVHASGKALVSLYQQYFSDVPFEQIFVKYSEDKRIRDFIRTLSIPIATEINIFDPNIVILGGGVLGMVDFPKKQLEESIFHYTRKPWPANGLTIEYAEDTDAAGILGAARSIYGRLYLNKGNLVC